jgi:DNA adenine methylase
MNSPVKWLGGKSWMEQKVSDIYSKHSEKRFVELFAGGMGLSFTMQPDRVLGNDLNKYLINFYNNLKLDPIQKFADFNNEEETYYKNRLLFNKHIDNGICDKLTAELFYYLNRCGYNGLYRVNSKGFFNSPFGHYKYSNAKQDLSEYAGITKNWEFTCGSYLGVDIKDDDFIFVDPPYDTEFTSYTSDGFSFDDQMDLVNFLSELKNPIILTNQNTPRMNKLLLDAGYDIDILQRPRNFRRGKDISDESKREIFATRNIS